MLANQYCLLCLCRFGVIQVSAAEVPSIKGNWTSLRFLKSKSNVFMKHIYKKTTVYRCNKFKIIKKVESIGGLN